ncbi:hypothetical protein ACFQ6V_23625 [Streptomyces roseifaciens]
MNTTTPDQLPHGYTLHALDQLVRTGILRNPWYQAVDTDERYAAGWHAAAELLYTATEPPLPHDLIHAAWYAADNMTRRSMEHRGIPRSRGEKYTGRDDVPHFHAYWTTVARHTASPEEPIVEHRALIQIWPHLTPRHQAALQALAVHEDYQTAADSLGLAYYTFCAHVRQARAVVLALWWEGETPRRGWRDRRRNTEPKQLHSISAHLRKRRRAKAT